MSRLSKLSPAVAALLSVAPGCKSMYDDAGATVPDATDAASEVVRFDGGGVGAACAATPDCREGLACAGGKCAPAGDRGLDKRCILSAECAGPTAECPNGLSCSWFGFCACAGAGGEGAPCTSSSDCAKGLACAAVGFSGYCEPRPDAGGDLDAPCADSKTCMAGLVCSAASKTCVPASLLLNPDLFPGVACPDESKTPFGVRMRLPRGDEPGEFYSLPFPTDVRRKADGHVDLHDHPRPGGGVFGVDPLDGILRAVEADIVGYPLDAAVYFRFTRPVDPSTVRTAADLATGVPATVRFVDLDDPARPVPFVARTAADRNKYICANHLYVHPVWSKPLRPNVRYAVVVTSGVRSLAAAGAQPEAPAHLDDLDLLLGSARPGGDAEGRAWGAFEPLRAWMKSAGVAAADVAGATVFTTGDPTAPLRAMGAFFHPAAGTQPAADMPVLAEVVECTKGKDVTACATPGWAETEAGKAGGADPRACPAAKPSGWTEYHARIRLPVFQEGDPPYLAGGGAIRADAGKPVVVRYEDVCAAFAIPDGDEPADGWPLLTYGHGTGGSFTNGMAWAATLAPQGIAVLSIDQPMHGPRRGIDRDPGPLFYNFLNPPAARGNLIQGAADNFSLVRFAAAFDGKIATRQVRFDRDRIAYMGHSQGATTGPLFVPWEDGLAGAVFTGAGGSLVLGLLGKKQPYDASVGIRGGLQELHVDETHPALAIIQWYFDGTDPLLHAPAMLAEPAGRPVHVLDVVGWDDSYTPWRTGMIFAAALGGPMILHAAGGDCRPGGCNAGDYEAGALGLESWILPTGQAYGGNVELGAAGTFTGLSVVSRSDGTYDGHFVGNRNPATRRVIERFVRTLMDPAEPFPAVVFDDDPCPDAPSAKCPD